MHGDNVVRSTPGTEIPNLSLVPSGACMHAWLYTSVAVTGRKRTLGGVIDIQTAITKDCQ